MRQKLWGVRDEEQQLTGVQWFDMDCRQAYRFLDKSCNKGSPRQTQVAKKDVGHQL